ncbi:MAG: glycosyl hydrolase family 18 protein [Candidatus Paceibacterota bacterium]
MKEIAYFLVIINMRKIFVGLGMVTLLAPVGFSQAAPLEVSGWIPWWQETMGIESASENISHLDTIYPFTFEMTAGGIPINKSDFSDRKWQDLFREAERNGVNVIPSILWNNGTEIHTVLSNPTWRALHIELIARTIEAGNFDGVNIDYESKLAETKDHYSAFLRELKARLGDKLLTCTVEARMAPQHRWRNIPPVIEYANDYEEIGKHCDAVEIMAYDQQRADLLLNDARKGEPYMPVADTEWVESVLELALKDIPAEKIKLGVPTYGRKWTLTVAPEWYKNYRGNGAINLPDAKELAKDNDVTVGRNAAGEASYTYFNPNSPFKILDALPVPDGTRVGFEAAAKALLFANLTEMEVPVEIVWYSDAEAISAKVELAKKYNIKGIAIFKIDGEEDQDIWKMF